MSTTGPRSISSLSRLSASAAADPRRSPLRRLPPARWVRCATAPQPGRQPSSQPGGLPEWIDAKQLLSLVERVIGIRRMVDRHPAPLWSTGAPNGQRSGSCQAVQDSGASDAAQLVLLLHSII